jgi:hypothetical protein
MRCEGINKENYDEEIECLQYPAEIPEAAANSQFFVGVCPPGSRCSPPAAGDHLAE